MVKSPREVAITQAILKRLNKRDGCYARKTHGGYYSATHLDIYGCDKGRMFVLEVKRPGKKLTRLQEIELLKWEAVGAIVGVPTSVDEAVGILEDVPVLVSCPPYESRVAELDNKSTHY
ncbi:MAG: hypothetical protein V3T23_12690 [Nitrososphaerales archaeon]